MPLAVITGANRGVGRALAEVFAERGAELLLLGRQLEALEALASRTEQLGSPRAQALACDLADESAVNRACDRILQLGVPEILVHNAGVVERAPIEEQSSLGWARQIAVNLSAPFWMTRALLSTMRRAGRGRILFVGSISSRIGSRGHAPYCASKWGVVGLMKSLAEELSESGLMTAAILPGSIDTEMLHGSGFAPRMTAREVAQTLAFYAFDASLAHNGAVVEMFGT